MNRNRIKKPETYNTTGQMRWTLELWTGDPLVTDWILLLLDEMMHHLYTNYHVSIFLHQYFNLLKKDKMRNNRIPRIWNSNINLKFESFVTGTCYC